MAWRHGAFSRRDAVLLLVGAFSMHIWSLILNQPTVYDPSPFSVVLSKEDMARDPPSTVTSVITKAATPHTRTLVQTETRTQTLTTTALSTPTPISQAIPPEGALASTSILAHAPGWTLFRNLYMSNGTLFIVAEEKDREQFPPIRMMTSTGLEAQNTPENIALREPTAENMDFLTPEEATRRWGAVSGGMNRVWSVEGNTVLFNDPDQFLRHYYHFVAELWFGVQAFWHGAFSKPIRSPTSPFHFSLSHPAPPPIHRAIFAHSNANGWRDDPQFNRYFLRAVLPSLTVEHQEDWQDRIFDTRPRPHEDATQGRAFHFPILLLTDRSAAHRGVLCGTKTQRTASEAWDIMRLKGKLRGIHVGGWWAPLRDAMWRFAGAPEGLRRDALPRLPETMRYNGKEGYEILEVEGMDATLPDEQIVQVGPETQKSLPEPDKVVISYISRQRSSRRKLIPEDHDAMVLAIREMVERRNGERRKLIEAFEGQDIDERSERKRAENGIPLEIEFNEVAAEKLTHDEQIQMAARTTIMLGVHGNGLTHLIFMNPNRYSTVIELFFPQGFAHDYQWTTRSLGMTHFSVWNDTYRTFDTKPEVAYPIGFQENSIPVYGPTVVQIIEDRIDGNL